MEENVGKSNWLEDKEKAGTLVTVDEVDELWQEAVRDLMEAERINKHLNGEDRYMQSKVLARLHAGLWELRDAAWKAVTDKSK